MVSYTTPERSEPPRLHVIITQVDIPRLKAMGREMKNGGPVAIDLSVHNSQTIVWPRENEEWFLTKINEAWVLDKKASLGNEGLLRDANPGDHVTVTTGDYHLEANAVNLNSPTTITNSLYVSQGVATTEISSDSAIVNSGSNAGWYQVDDAQFAPSIYENIGPEGSTNVRNLSVSRDMTFGGISLQDRLDALPRGLIAVGVRTTDSSSTNAGANEVSLYELAFNAEAGRYYRMYCTTVYVRSDGNNSNAGRGFLRLRVTTNGATPSFTSQLMLDSPVYTGDTKLTTTFAQGSNQLTNLQVDPNNKFSIVATDVTTISGATHNHLMNHVHEYGQTHNHSIPSSWVTTSISAINGFGTGRIRLLFSFGCDNDPFTGVTPSLRVVPPAGNVGIQFCVEDVGLGTNVVASAAARSIKSYLCTWTAKFNSNLSDGTGTSYVGVGLEQGLNPTDNKYYYSMIGFDDAQIRSDISGSSIERVQLVLNNAYCDPYGATIVLGTHNATSGTTTYSTVTSSLSSMYLTPGQSDSIDLGTSVGTSFVNSSIRGLVMNGIVPSRCFYTDNLQPKLIITYTK